MSSQSVIPVWETLPQTAKHLNKAPQTTITQSDLYTSTRTNYSAKINEKQMKDKLHGRTKDWRFFGKLQCEIRSDCT